MSKYKTREEWLVEATKIMNTELLSEVGVKLPKKWSITCGFPFKSPKAIGQCWDPTVTKDGTTHMLVCPSLGENMVDLLGTLLHEMIHAAVGIDQKHGGEFKRVAIAVGLDGPMRSTTVPESGELHKKLMKINRSLGKYPHSPLSKGSGGGRKKPAGGGWVRLQSTNNPKYRVVISPAQFEEWGAPTDPWGDVMEPIKK